MEDDDVVDMEGEVADENEDDMEEGGATLEPRYVLKPQFPPLRQKQAKEGLTDRRKVRVPPHRLTPLKENWLKIYEPIVEHLKLQVRYNVVSRAVEIRTCPVTVDNGALQRATDFVQAFILGFSLEDAVALLRLDDLYIETFEVEDVKMLKNDNLSRAIGRIAGKDGKTKFTIENATRTRIVVADRKIHILGSYTNIKIARDAICDLILGSPAGKVYAKLQSLSSRSRSAF